VAFLFSLYGTDKNPSIDYPVCDEIYLK